MLAAEHRERCRGSAAAAPADAPQPPRAPRPAHPPTHPHPPHAPQAAAREHEAVRNAYATLMPLAITAGPMQTTPTGYDPSGGMGYGQQAYGGYTGAPGYGGY